eukprot:TRINITY_DN67882_c8_g1_i7.p2 TRINITY_DN67882_c8_g1~~TRINITY_DN67882_c8_g1_i7.p2  ORF type:complete len:147 (+),score=10.99 TRINITY_DN67882_c8_g1_i7:514-954(+)
MNDQQCVVEFVSWLYSSFVHFVESRIQVILLICFAEHTHQRGEHVNVILNTSSLHLLSDLRQCLPLVRIPVNRQQSTEGLAVGFYLSFPHVLSDLLNLTPHFGFPEGFDKEIVAMRLQHAVERSSLSVHRLKFNQVRLGQCCEDLD